MMKTANTNLTKLRTVKEKVEHTLINHPATRSNDKLLQVKVLEDFYGVIFLSDILNADIPSLESIRRSRALIQAEGKYLPDEVVLRARVARRKVFNKLNTLYRLRK